MAKIMVLDDIADIGVLLKLILERKGYDVKAFTDEEDALDYARSNDVDLAILDIKLKKKSGVDILAELKKNEPGMGVIMLTGYPTIGTASESFRLGASEYCTKPIDKEELEKKVADVLAKRK